MKSDVSENRLTKVPTLHPVASGALANAKVQPLSGYMLKGIVHTKLAFS